MNLLHVFVYGTLKPGEAYYPSYCADQVVETQPAIAIGQLYALPLGYPAMTEGMGVVHGFVLSLAGSQVLTMLDQLEDYQFERSPEQNLYQRQPIPVFTPEQQSLGMAWAYLMQLEQVRRLGGVLLPEGNWNGHRAYFY